MGKNPVRSAMASASFPWQRSVISRIDIQFFYWHQEGCLFYAKVAAVEFGIRFLDQRHPQGMVLPAAAAETISMHKTIGECQHLR